MIKSKQKILFWAVTLFNNPLAFERPKFIFVLLKQTQKMQGSVVKAFTWDEQCKDSSEDQLEPLDILDQYRKETKEKKK